MAAPTTEQLKAAIITQVSLVGDAAFAAHLDILWTIYEAEGLVHPRLQYWLALRDAYLYKISLIERPYDWKEADVSESGSDAVKVWLDAIKGLNEMMMAFRAQLAQGGGIVVGQMTRTAPIQADDPREWMFPDPNAMRHRGSPLEPGWPWPGVR
jgi:hypothetical protein